MSINQNNLISIVMPTYNAEKYIEEAILSVLYQTYENFELIIINDCSFDKTLELINKFKEIDSRVYIYSNKTNLGVSFSRNLGVKKAKGKWISFLDSDDLWEKNKLEKQIELIEKNPKVVICYTASSFIDSKANKYSYILKAKEELSYKQLLNGNLISCSSVLIKKSVMETVGMSSDKMHEDYAAWLTILKKQRYAYGINEPLLIYRLTDGSKSSKRITSAKMTYKTYRYVGYNPIVSMLFTLRYAKHSILKRLLIKISRQNR